MSNPVAPGAGSLEALIAKWRDRAKYWRFPDADYTGGDANIECADELEALLASAGRSPVHPFSAWHEDYHDVLWWRFPIEEPPYVGSPLNDDWPFSADDESSLGWTRYEVPTVQPPPLKE